MGYVGLGTMTKSPGFVMAKARCESPSFTPMVTMDSSSGVDIHIVAAAIPIGDGRSQPGDCRAKRCSDDFWGSSPLPRVFFHDVRRGGEVGVPHAEIDDVVHPRRRASIFNSSTAGKDVGRQAVMRWNSCMFKNPQLTGKDIRRWGGAGTFRPEPSLVIKARALGVSLQFPPPAIPREACKASSAL